VSVHDVESPFLLQVTSKLRTKGFEEGTISWSLNNIILPDAAKTWIISYNDKIVNLGKFYENTHHSNIRRPTFLVITCSRNIS